MFIELLRPLVSDTCSTVRQCAVVAVARLAEHDEGVAQKVLDGGMLTITLENLHKYNVQLCCNYLSMYFESNTLFRTSRYHHT